MGGCTALRTYSSAMQRGFFGRVFFFCEREFVQKGAGDGDGDGSLDFRFVGLVLWLGGDSHGIKNGILRSTCRMEVEPMD